jgi:hypothetical protein
VASAVRVAAFLPAATTGRSNSIKIGVCCSLSRRTFQPELFVWRFLAVNWLRSNPAPACNGWWVGICNDLVLLCGAVRTGLTALPRGPANVGKAKSRVRLIAATIVLRYLIIILDKNLTPFFAMSNRRLWLGIDCGCRYTRQLAADLKSRTTHTLSRLVAVQHDRLYCLCLAAGKSS